MEENITEIVTSLLFQLAVIFFAVRIFGKLAVKVGIPSVLGELVAGIVIGPYALGALKLPGFPQGLFPLNSESLAVNPELYSISQIASIILLFASGIETDLSLFLKYSVSGGIIGFGGVAVSFLLGDVCSMLMLHTHFMDVRCLFLGIMSTATSVGITARILSDKKKMDSPEGVTILAAAVFDDVLGIVLLAVVMGIVSALGGGGSLSGADIALIALKAFSIWLVFTLIFIVFAKKIAQFVRLFGGTFDFTMAALGVSFLLAGFFEKQGLAMIIGAYTTGLALSRTDIAPVIQERIRGLYKFFVPVFFAVMGMSVNVSQLLNREVLIFGAIYTIVGVIAKLLGCGGPALALGFNAKGAFRIGAGMIPRGEVALIIAGIGLASGIIDQKIFGVVILMTLVTTLVAPPVLTVSLGIKGRGTRKESESSESQTFEWDFDNADIAQMVIDLIVRDLRGEGFYVQTMNINEGIIQARKGKVALSIHIEDSKLVAETSAEDMGFVKAEIYEVILRFNKSLKSIESLKEIFLSQSKMIGSQNRVEKRIVKYLSPKCIKCGLSATDKDGIIREMCELAAASGAVSDVEKLIDAVKDREKQMSTGLDRGIAIPHAHTDGVEELCVAIGIKKDGVDYAALDGNASNIFVLIASPADKTSPHMMLLSEMTGILMQSDIREKMLSAKTAEEVIDIIKECKKM